VFIISTISNVFVSLAKIKKVASPIIPIKLNFINKYSIDVDGKYIFRAIWQKYKVIAKIIVHIKIFFIVIFNSFEIVQKPRFFKP